VAESLFLANAAALSAPFLAAVVAPAFAADAALPANLEAPLAALAPAEPIAAPTFPNFAKADMVYK
jgi:hypothetical protein